MANEIKLQQNNPPTIRLNYDHIQTPGIDKFSPSLTKQSMKDECDLNIILKKYQSTGILPDMIKTDPQYGDFSAVPDYQSALDIINKAELQFSSLEAQVRIRFQNDPAEFLAFATDPKNSEELIKMGLATARPQVSTSVEKKSAPVAQPQGLPDAKA